MAETDKTYDNILSKIHDTPWYITQHGMELIVSIVDRKMRGEELPEDMMNEIVAKNRKTGDKLELPKKPSIATLPISGPIFPKANLMTSLSGATSIEKLKSDFDQLMESDMVSGIVLDIDSPGGAVTMTPEFADHIFESRGKKPIYAVANGMACSGAYYIGSQADKFFSTPSGMVGSIGVVATHMESSEKDSKEGIKYTVLSVGKHKADGNPHEPLSDDAKESRLEVMQEVYDDFVNAVARGRDTTPDNVLENFGEGKVFYPKAALQRGMIDGIETLESVVGNLSNPSKKHSTISVNKKGDKMDGITPETLEVLGLTEDATAEDIENAVSELKASIGTEKDSAVTVINPDLEKQFPEVAAQLKADNARIAKLEADSRRNEAHLFSMGYAQFSSDTGKTGKGFSGLALEQVENIHLAISDGLLTHESFKTFLDNVASENAVVDYRELGSNRGDEGGDDVDTGQEAAEKLRDLALAKATEDGLSYGDALSAVMEENQELAKKYRTSLPKGPGGVN